jgi:predicted RNA-binding Zn-ribbon protein involved in translation (DUF1610 family)
MTQVDAVLLASAVFTLSMLYLFWPRSTGSTEAPIETPADPEVNPISYFVQMYCCGLLLIRCADNGDGRDGERVYVCSECGREVWVVVRKQVTEEKHASRNHAGARG